MQGRPLVDTLKRSKHANMKELRFDAGGGVWRAAFALDPEKKAIGLVAGDKSGVSEKRFHRSLIATADAAVRCTSRNGQQAEAEEMSKTLAQIMAEMPEDERAEVKARTADILAEIDGLAELRRLVGLTQGQVAFKLTGVGELTV